MGNILFINLYKNPVNLSIFIENRIIFIINRFLESMSAPPLPAAIEPGR